ncbi:sensor histidine kinase [Salmonirosea aquatica]|uniref:sensor histidine kinase n=1 Tax=Salmonirosea aquatica TaxID=2654236 RepID=UPI0035712CC2
MLVFGTVSFIVIIVFLVSFVGLYQKKQFQYQAEKIALKNSYEREILESQLAVQNSTLQHVSQDLHDNVGQLLMVAGLNLRTLKEKAQKTDLLGQIQQTDEIVRQAIAEIRALTKSLDGEFVNRFGLLESLNYEMERLTKTQQIKADLTVEGESYALSHEHEIVLFRMVQESLSNTMKYAEARHIRVQLAYQPNRLILEVEDDGKGFDLAEVLSRELADSGAGLKNMQRRARLIGGTCDFHPTVGQGTKITITVPRTTGTL